jgi:very-short-patch-repair endonuclease
VAARLAALGITVVPQYGVGGYRVDFAAAHPDDPTRMILAVEADGASYRDSRSVRDRDRLRKEHLERLGWRVHRLWSTSWFTDPDAELAKLRAAYAEAVRANPPAPPPRPAAPPSAGLAAESSSAGERSGSAEPPATAEPAPAGEPPLTANPSSTVDRPTPAPSVTGATRVPIALPARTVTPVEGPPPSRALPPIPPS